jgi:hypothetical protein
MHARARALVLVAAVAAVFFVPVLVVPALALAQHPAGDPPEYRPTVDAALAEFEAGRWAEARALFTQAHALFPNARTLRGIGMTSFELRDYPVALEALDGALASTTRALTEEQRAQVTALRDRARVFVGRYHLAPMPAGTEVFVDAVHVTIAGAWPLAEGTVVLGIGEHTIEARLAGHAPSVAHVLVRGGEEDTLGLSFTEPARVDAPPDETEPEPRDRVPTVPPEPPPSGPGLAPWILLGAGGAALIVGAVLVGVGAEDEHTVESAPRSTEWASISDAFARAPVLEGVGGALLGVGAALATVGVVWAVLGNGSTRTEVAIGPGHLGARLRW